MLCNSIRMKNRDYKNFAIGNFYHIINRGNNKKIIFFDDNDFLFFLSRLRECLFPENIQKHRGSYIRKPLPPGAFSLVNYILMPNHFHFIIRQNTTLPITKIFSKICTGYSMYFNKKYHHVGQVFQDQFKAILIDTEAYLLWLSAYIHQNPKVAGLVNNLADYRWSSYREYLGLTKDSLCDTSILFSIFKLDKKLYKAFVENTFEIIKQKKEIQHLLLDSTEDAPVDIGGASST